MGGVGSTLAVAELTSPSTKHSLSEPDPPTQPISSTRRELDGDFELVEHANGSTTSEANSHTIHAEESLVRGLGQTAVSLKLGAVAAVLALLTVPSEHQHQLMLALQVAIAMVMLWLWCFVLPALRTATEVGGPHGDEAAAKKSNPDGELVWAEDLPGRINSAGMPGLARWGEPDGRSFNLRGRSYMSDKVKMASDESFFRLVALDFFKFADHKERFGIASRPDNWVQQANTAARARGGVAPFTFVLNVVIPSSVNMSMVIYFQVRREEDMLSDRPEAKLLRAFIAGDTAYRNERFKLLARPRGSALLRTLIGDKPALIGRKLAMPYFSGPNHFEVCVDVTSNTFAEYVTRVARDAVATNMSLDLGFTIEGRCEEVWARRPARYPTRHAARDPASDAARYPPSWRRTSLSEMPPARPPRPPAAPPRPPTCRAPHCQELPERVFGACHVNKVDLNNSCVQLPPRSELPG